MANYVCMLESMRLYPGARSCLNFFGQVNPKVLRLEYTSKLFRKKTYAKNEIYKKYLRSKFFRLCGHYGHVRVMVAHPGSHQEPKRQALVPHGAHKKKWRQAWVGL